jgi:MFS family permease
MRLTTGPILRRYGFRTVLIGNAVLSGAAMIVCLFFTASTPFLVIFGVLLFGGFFPALQFTALQVLAYADVTPAQMGSSTSIASMIQQLSRGFGIAFIADLLHVTQFLRGEDGLSLIDLHVAFGAATILILLSIVFYLPLSRDAAADVSGHVGRSRGG